MRDACRYAVAAAVAWAVWLPGMSLAQVEILKKEPPAGQVWYGKIVYIDDGTCPSGEIKEMTGGSLAKSIPRKVRCVKRPK
jgi:hypothetical protein